MIVTEEPLHTRSERQHQSKFVQSSKVCSTEQLRVISKPEKRCSSNTGTECRGSITLKERECGEKVVASP